MTGISESRGDERSRENPASVGETSNVPVSRRRRTVLRILLEADDASITFSDLAAETTAREGGDRFVDHDMVILDLHHRQLPKLADIGVVEYDRERGVVKYDGDDEIELLLE